MTNNFSYIFPNNFKEDLIEYAGQKNRNMAKSLGNCSFECTDEGLAYYAGMKGDVWDKHAVNLKIFGNKKDLEQLKWQEKPLRSLINVVLNPNKTGLIICDIFYKEDGVIGYATNNERLERDIKTANTVLCDIVSIAEQLCNNVIYNGKMEENFINDYLRDALKNKGHSGIRDQSRHGVAESNKDAAGEVDILIMEEGREVALLECLKLNSVNKGIIKRHIEKAINNYNALGTATFIVSYVTTKDFSRFYESYYEYISNYDFKQESNTRNETELEELPQMNASVKAARRIISKDGYKMPLYFVTIKIS